MPIRTFGYPGIFGEGWHSAEIAGGPLNGKYEIDFNMDYPDTLGGLSGAPVFLSGDKTYSVVGVISNHGPKNFQKGKIVPTKAFYAQINEILAQEKQPDVWCYVVLSEADKKKTPHTLEHTVQIAFNNFPQVKDGRKPLKQEYATDLVSSPERYREAVRKICQAWTDLGLFNLFSNDYSAARVAYEQATQLGARSPNYKSTISVLEQLQQTLDVAESPMAKSVAQPISEIIDFLKKERAQKFGVS